MKQLENIKISTILFYISYFLLIFQSMTRWVHNIEFLQNICPILIFGSLVISIILQYKKIEKNKLIIITLISIISFCSYWESRDIAILYIVIFAIAFKDKEYRNLIKFDLIIKTAMLLLIFFLYSKGLTEKIIYYYNARGVRYSLGFGHPNTLGMYLLNICADIAYLNYDKKRISLYILIISIAVFVNYVPRSRGASIAIILLIIFSYIIPLIKNNQIFKIVAKNLCVFFIIISFLSGLIFLQNKLGILVKLNEIFSNRINLIADFLKTYPITAFGNNFVNYNTNNLGNVYTLDNAYITILLKYGLLVTIICSLMMNFNIRQALHNKKYAIIMCLLTYMFLGLMENGFYVLAYNPFLLSFSELICSNRKEGDNNENVKLNKE